MITVESKHTGDKYVAVRDKSGLWSYMNIVTGAHGYSNDDNFWRNHYVKGGD